MAIPSWVDAWLGERSADTRATYRDSLGLFARAIGIAETSGDWQAGVNALLSCPDSASAYGLIGRWRAEMDGRGLSPATVRLRLATAASLLSKADALGAIAWRPPKLRMPESRPVRDVSGVADEDVGKMAVAASQTGDKERNLAVLALLRSGGLRRVEVARLTKADVTLAGPLVRVAVHGKGGGGRVVALAGEPAALVRAWLRLAGEGGSLFGLTRGGVRAVLQRLGKRAGLGPRQVGSHRFRHAFLTDAANVDEDAAALAAGHKSVGTTRRYRDDRQKRADGLSAGLCRSATWTPKLIEPGV